MRDKDLKILLSYIVQRFVPYDIKDRLHAWELLDAIWPEKKDILSEPERWATENPDAWKALRDNEAIVIPHTDNDVVKTVLWYGDSDEYTAEEARMDKPFKPAGEQP